MKPFKATHKIVDESGDLAWDESDALVMEVGGMAGGPRYATEQTWTDGGFYFLAADLEQNGHKLLPIAA